MKLDSYKTSLEKLIRGEDFVCRWGWGMNINGGYRVGACGDTMTRIRNGKATDWNYRVAENNPKLTALVKDYEKAVLPPDD